MNNLFDTTIEQYEFNASGLDVLKTDSIHSIDWPVVYILNGNKEAYIGETQSALDRMNQHLLNKDTIRKNLTKITLVQSDSFNKSAILDIENMLISHMHADQKFILQNANSGQSKLHNYYQRSVYQNVFADLWEKLKKYDLVNHNLYEVENSEIYKYSPYKELTADQYKIVEQLLSSFCERINDTSNTRINVIVNGGAGTGKTLIAIYFLNVIANIVSNNYYVSSMEDETLDDDSFLKRSNLIKQIKDVDLHKICFVTSVPTFKDTINDVFKSIKELKSIKVLSPSELAKENDFDIVIVDEAHRLKRRNKLTNYGTNRLLGLDSSATELDWVKAKAKKMLIMFYDEKQSIRETDVLRDDFLALQNENSKTFNLSTQLRVKGGNEYINFINQLFADNSVEYHVDNYDFKIYDDCKMMFEDIKSKNKEYNGLCRILSGLSFGWRKQARDKKDKKYDRDYDFEIDGNHYLWNDGYNALKFITDDKNIDRVGCVYTCQGYDLNYAGVILGEDITYNKEKKIIE